MVRDALKITWELVRDVSAFIAPLVAFFIVLILW